MDPDPPQAQMVITLNANGSVTIAGPINNKLLSYGLLESARKALDDFVPTEQPLVMLPSMRLNGPLR
jgi:hypothetical protein